MRLAAVPRMTRIGRNVLAPGLGNRSALRMRIPARPYHTPVTRAANSGTPTNVPNQWQGALRFAPLDVSALVRRIGLDLRDSRLVRSVDIAVTCLDHLESADLESIDLESHILDALADRFGANNVLTSRGPTRADVCGLAVHA